MEKKEIQWEEKRERESGMIQDQVFAGEEINWWGFFPDDSLKRLQEGVQSGNCRCDLGK